MPDASHTPTQPLTRPEFPATFDAETVAQIYAFWEQHNLFAPEAQPNAQGEHFSIVIPPPNVTGTLHMGHALDNAIQDVAVRWRRMCGVPTVWIPGTDHAGIATQNVVEKRLRAGEVDGYPKGTTRHHVGREAFLKLVWEWAIARQGDILGQFRRLGISADWSRQRFTFQPELQASVKKAFVTLYNQGLIYRGERIVNWCPRCLSAISDVETDYADQESALYHLKYAIEGTTGDFLTIATTRPETIFADVAVAVHPEDPRYHHLLGQQVRIPLTGRTVPVIADAVVEPEFGTGSLKITPAHDANDFEVGQRHGLTPVWVITPGGKLADDNDDIPQALRGLDRFEARKAIVPLLEEVGLLADTQPHKNRVGQCQRCSTVIEPYLSKQWFVATKPLADKALASLERGEMTFIPQRWEKDYLRWMTNIQDWCISRQLWWGHAIPAWHHNQTGEVYVGEEPPADAENWTPDPDVLDTWFSSGLWPFATLGWGWPEGTLGANADDLKRFYPTTALVTGFDIIFFWVARMVMMGHALTGQSPFKTVYIHGLIRDEKGQKMSKSKGNTVDPVVEIDKWGVDGFRFGLLSMVSYGGQDIKLNREKLEQGKFFTNKLTNLTRFALMNLPPEAAASLRPLTPADADTLPLTPVDRWILSRAHRTAALLNQQLKEWRFAEATDALLSFIWDDLCDWYVESSKWLLRQGDAQADATRRVLLTVLSMALRLLHPIMPHLTEWLWGQLPEAFRCDSPSVSLAPYPVAEGVWLNDALEQDVPVLFQVVRALRNIRQSYQVPHGEETAATIAMAGDTPEAIRALLTSHTAFLQHFVKLSSLSLHEGAYCPPDRATGMNPVGAYLRVYVPLTGLIDIEAEIGRLQKKLTQLEGQQTQLEKLLGNPGFLAKATEEVLAEKRAQQKDAQEQCASLREQLAVLMGQ